MFFNLLHIILFIGCLVLGNTFYTLSKIHESSKFQNLGFLLSYFFYLISLELLLLILNWTNLLFLIVGIHTIITIKLIYCIAKSSAENFQSAIDECVFSARSKEEIHQQIMKERP